MLLADDHPLMLDGLVAGLLRIGYDNITTAVNGLEVLNKIQAQEFDILILDIEMPNYNGFEVVEQIQERKILLPVIFLSYHKEKRYLLVAKKLKVQGYLLKEDGIEVLHNCIQQVLIGKEFYSPSLDQGIRSAVSEELTSLADLTKSERLILKCISDGMSSAEVAVKLNVSKRTIQNHRFNINQKLKEDLNGVELSQWSIINKALIGRL